MAAFRKWRIKLEEPGNFVDRKTVPDPPGYHANAIRDGSSGSSLARKKQGQGLKKQQALIAKAQSQFQKVFPLCLMMFMSGNGVQLFSIFTVITGIWTPVQSILRVLDVFPADDDRMVDVWSPRALYCLIHGGALLFALYKLHNMQLLPISPADWVSAFEVPAAVEASAGVIL